MQRRARKHPAIVKGQGVPFVSDWERAQEAKADFERRSKLPRYRTIDAYLTDHPEAEGFRRWMTAVTQRNRTSPIWIFPTDGTQHGLPGDYLWAFVVERSDGLFVTVHDRDDRLTVRPVKDAAEADELMAQVCDVAPVRFDELDAVFGFLGDA
jgi:hypothetical protein